MDGGVFMADIDDLDACACDRVPQWLDMATYETVDTCDAL
jgi:hypothetical protein